MDLNLFVGEVERRAASDEPLARLAAAVQLREELTAQSDQLLDHLVHEARDAGCSWTQIGGTLGVSKQAAQQRHGVGGLRAFFRGWRDRGRLFQRFTPRARHVVVDAQGIAREMGHASIGTEHVLVGLFSDEQSIAARVLAERGITRDDVVAAIRELDDDTERPPVKGHIPFSDGAKDALEMALQEAIDLGHNYIGTEHQLLGLLRVDDDAAAHILRSRGITLADTRSAVLQLLGQMAKPATDGDG
jgi:hypothetical protein